MRLWMSLRHSTKGDTLLILRGHIRPECNTEGCHCHFKGVQGCIGFRAEGTDFEV